MTNVFPSAAGVIAHNCVRAGCVIACVVAPLMRVVGAVTATAVSSQQCCCAPESVAPNDCTWNSSTLQPESSSSRMLHAMYTPTTRAEHVW
jgi:hypothetical protein